VDAAGLALNLTRIRYSPVTSDVQIVTLLIGDQGILIVYIYICVVASGAMLFIVTAAVKRIALKIRS